MAGISSLGIGSGLDLGALVDSLLQAERAPAENSLNRRESRLVTDLSGVGLMRSALAEFQSSLADFRDAGSFAIRQFSTSNNDAMGVDVNEDAEVGSYSIEINSLARSQSVASSAYSSVTDTIGSGSIQIRYGSITGPGFTSFSVNPERAIETITVDSGNNTLVGLKDTINDGNFGFTAAIVNDGSGYRLTLTSDESGVDNAMEIVVSDSGDGNDTDANGLSSLAYNAAAANLAETQSAADANFSVNGLAISKSSNSVSDVIEGVTLTLNQTTTAAFTVNVSESSNQLETSVRGVVGAYNDMISSLGDLAAPGGDGADAGILFGDASLRNFVNSLRRMMTSAVDGLDGSVTALANIGIRTQADGSLAIDDAKFSTALAENPTDLLALFVPVGQTSDSLVDFDSATTSAIPGSYPINLSTIATQGVLNGAGGVNNLTVDADNDEFTIFVDGVSSGGITLTQGVYATAEQLAAEIQTQVNSVGAFQGGGISVSVNYDAANDRFDIASNRYGASSAVEITAIDTDTAADFGLSVAAGTAGVDVAGSIGGSAASGDGRSLAINGLTVEVLGGGIGNRGTLNFSRGFVEDLHRLLDDFLAPVGGSLGAREDGLNESLEDLSNERATLELRLQAVERRLIAQFSALDQLLAQFQTTGNYLTQQINNLPGSGQLLKN